MSKRSETRREQRRRDAQRLNDLAKRARALQEATEDGGEVRAQFVARVTRSAADSLPVADGLARASVEKTSIHAYSRSAVPWGWFQYGQPISEAPEPEGSALTFGECVVGYRNWIVDATGQLRAITMTKQAWVPGVNEAKCRPHDMAPKVIGDVMSAMGKLMLAARVVEESHPAPHPTCDCGFYAWNDIPEFPSQADDVDSSGCLAAFGAVAARGDLRVHPDGFRASHACVVALAYGSDTSDRVRRTLERVAVEYRVPLVHVEALRAEAERHGSPLPVDVRPTWSGGAR